MIYCNSIALLFGVFDGCFSLVLFDFFATDDNDVVIDTGPAKLSINERSPLLGNEASAIAAQSSQSSSSRRKKKRRETSNAKFQPMSLKLRVAMLRDAARGVLYLHR